MIRSLLYTPGKPLQTDLPPEALTRALRSRRSLLWLDFTGEPPQVCEPILRRFGFHPLAIDDALQELHSPKVDDWGDYLYIVMNTLTLRADQAGVAPGVEELDIFLGPNFVVTHHDTPIHCIDHTFSACQRDQRHLRDGADHLLYRIIDNLVADYMPLVEQVDNELDRLEDQVFDSPSPATIENLFTLKRTLLAMRRILTPQREVLNKLARDDYRMIDPKDRVFFRDVYDHLVRLHDLNESMRDLVGGALDTYLSVINNRMNEIMKTLTVITTLFMPISFIVGFFGMNFFTPPTGLAAWTASPAFLATLLLLLLIPAGMFFWISRRHWL